jgi:hypothetical protein
MSSLSKPVFDIIGNTSIASSPKAKKILDNLTGPIYVLGVWGRGRVGKSTILQEMAAILTGVPGVYFIAGNSFGPLTSGADILVVPHPDIPTAHILLVDLEGCDHGRQNLHPFIVGIGSILCSFGVLVLVEYGTILTNGLKLLVTLKNIQALSDKTNNGKRNILFVENSSSRWNSGTEQDQLNYLLNDKSDSSLTDIQNMIQTEFVCELMRLPHIVQKSSDFHLTCKTLVDKCKHLMKPYKLGGIDATGKDIINLIEASIKSITSNYSTLDPSLATYSVVTAAANRKKDECLKATKKELGNPLPNIATITKSWQGFSSALQPQTAVASVIAAYDKEFARLVEKSVTDKKVDVLKKITTCLKTNPVYSTLHANFTSYCNAINHKKLTKTIVSQYEVELETIIKKSAQNQSVLAETNMKQRIQNDPLLGSVTGIPPLNQYDTAMQNMYLSVKAPFDAYCNKLTPPGLTVDAIKYLQNAYTAQVQIIHNNHIDMNQIIQVEAEFSETKTGEETKFSHHVNRDFVFRAEEYDVIRVYHIYTKNTRTMTRKKNGEKIYSAWVHNGTDKRPADTRHENYKSYNKVPNPIPFM